MNALVIGSHGAIGQALVSALLCDDAIEQIFSVSRSNQTLQHQKITHTLLDSTEENEVAAFVERVSEQGVRFHFIFCCIGALHAQNGSQRVFPEKKLEQMNSELLEYYFQINTIAPANWLSVVPTLVPKNEPSKVIFFSARVGSIEDNRLGGWYGYRASKAALNMLVKTAQIELSRRIPQTIFVCYHPGTVDSALSKPFQAQVNPEKLFTPDYTVACLLNLLKTLTREKAPYYIDWQGKTIPW